MNAPELAPTLVVPETSNISVARAVSEAEDARLAAEEIWDALAGVDAACIVFFCCYHYDRSVLAESLSTLFDGCAVVGCTTSGEITPRGMTKRSITAFALSREHFVVETIFFNNLASFSAEQAYHVVQQKVARLGRRALVQSPGHSFALSLLDGMSICEELVLRSLNDALNGIPLVGGSAGDNLNFCDTYVYHEGKFHDNAAVMLLINTVCPFEVVSSHHFTADSEKLVVTRADPARRVAIEINAEPAALEYCRVMGLSLDELSTSRMFALHPLSVQVGEHLYVRSIQQVNDDLSLTFFCAIDNGIVLTKLRDAGMVNHFKAMMFDVVDRIGEPQLTIGYDCIHRCMEAEERNLCDDIAALYQRYRVIGFNTYGEQHNGLHINHTFTGVVIGSPRV